MSTLIFKNKNLRGILRFTRRATVFRATFAEAVAAYEKDTRKRYVHGVNIERYYEHERPTIWLVKDEGIYLMTSAKLEETPKDRSHVCYAEGYEPDAPNSWEKCRNAVGGDDFAESIPFPITSQAAILKGADIRIEFGSNAFSVSLVYPG